MPRFTFHSAGAQKTVELTGDLVVVGSDAACGLVLPDSGVSAVHCEFRRGANGWRVVDLESREGTSVNGEFVNQRVLSDGDVIQIGGVRGTISGLGAAAAPPLRPAAAPARGAVAPARAPGGAASGRTGGRTGPRTGAARGRGDADGAAGEEGEQRPARRKKASGTPVLVVAGCVVGLAILAFIVVPDKDMGANYDIRTQMTSAAGRNDWQEVVRLASQADPEADKSNFVYIKEMRDRAEVALRSEQNAAQNSVALAEWNTLLTWWQANDFKDQAGYQQRLDEYLAKFGHLGSPGPTQARIERVRYFGSASPGPIPDGEAGFAAIKTDVELLGSAGRFGEAITRLDEWWKRSASSSSGMATQVDAVRAQALKLAEKWIDTQIGKARFQKDRGENRKAEKTLLDAAEKIGIPELAKKAREAINSL